MDWHSKIRGLAGQLRPAMLVCGMIETSASETKRAADPKRPDLERLRAAWAAAAEALHAAERADESADAMRADRDAQSRFMAILAHELKNPLNAIYGYAQFMRQPELQGEAPSRMDNLATIEAAAKHL